MVIVIFIRVNLQVMCNQNLRKQIMLVGVMQLQNRGQDVKEMLQEGEGIVGNINNYN
jgi:hypothetical protein